MWLVAGLSWYVACLGIETPRLFGDELNYWDMARSFHHGARIPYWSVNYDIPTQFYSWLISPVFGLTSLTSAYHAARVSTPFLIASAVFPAYLLARELLDQQHAMVVAVLSALLPGMAYSSTLMTENLFYPLFVAAFWAAYRVLCSGRVRDSILAGLFFVLAYYAKPHLLVLVIAYSFCLAVWLVQALGPGNEPREAGRGIAIRLLPSAVLLLAIATRFLTLPPNERGLEAILVGAGYQHLLQARIVMPLADVFAAWSGLVLSCLIAALFVPFALFFASGMRLKRMERPQQFFWLLTAMVWILYTGLSARHTVLNDGSIRVHERYIFMILPCFFTWYFVAREQHSRRFILVASAISVLGGSAIMYWPARVFLTPHLNTDSPSLTGFLCLAWLCDLSFLQLAMLVLAIGVGATAAILPRRLTIQVALWAAMLACVSLGWIEFEIRWINPLHVRLRNVALQVSNQVGPQASLGVLLENRNWLQRFHLDFWMHQPTILYGVNPGSQVPGSFNWNSPYVRGLYRRNDGTLDFGKPAPDYLLCNFEMPGPYPLVRTFPDTNESILYLYRINRGGP